MKPQTIKKKALTNLSSLIQPDGGMPGLSDEGRVLSTILALLQFLAAGNISDQGPFKSQVESLIHFLESSSLQNATLREFISFTRAGYALEDDWLRESPSPALWDELQTAMDDDMGWQFKKAKDADDALPPEERDAWYEAWLATLPERVDLSPGKDSVIAIFFGQRKSGPAPRFPRKSKKLKGSAEKT